MHERVQGYTDAVLEDLGGGVGAVTDELQAFASLLAGSSDLRSVLAGTTTPAPVRRAVLHELLAARVSLPALKLISFAVQGGPADAFLDDFAGIIAATIAKRDGMVALDEGPLGRVAAGERLEGYATAVLSVQDKRQLANIEDELFRFMRIVEANAELGAALSTPELPAAVREAVVRDLLAGRASAESGRLASYAARKGRPRDFLLLVQGLIERAAKEADLRIADVRSAVEMTAAERTRLAEVLTSFTGHPVEVRVRAQPDLLGGFVASVGDVLMDASLRHRLDQARDLLLALPALPGGPAPDRPDGDRKDF